MDYLHIVLDNIMAYIDTQAFVWVCIIAGYCFLWLVIALNFHRIFIRRKDGYVRTWYTRRERIE